MLSRETPLSPSAESCVAGLVRGTVRLPALPLSSVASGTQRVQPGSLPFAFSCAVGAEGGVGGMQKGQHGMCTVGWIVRPEGAWDEISQGSLQTYNFTQEAGLQWPMCGDTAGKVVCCFVFFKCPALIGEWVNLNLPKRKKFLVLCSVSLCSYILFLTTP